MELSRKRPIIRRENKKNLPSWFQKPKEDELTKTKSLWDWRFGKSIIASFASFRKAVQLAKKVSAKELGIEFEKINALLGTWKKPNLQEKKVICGKL